VAGRLDAVGQEALEDLSVDFDDANTVLSGELDQAALYGVLYRILALDLELVTVSRVADDPPKGQARNGRGEPS
jgi:hypothetical protein